MYAVVKTGGKQYRVAAGDTLKVEKLDGEPGQTIQLDEVLMVNTGGEILLGQPRVAGASVAAEILEQDRDRKVIVFKYRRRKRYRRKNGHRQMYTQLKITGIDAASTSGASAAE